MTKLFDVDLPEVVGSHTILIGGIRHNVFITQDPQTRSFQLEFRDDFASGDGAFFWRKSGTKAPNTLRYWGGAAEGLPTSTRLTLRLTREFVSLQDIECVARYERGTVRIFVPEPEIRRGLLAIRHFSETTSTADGPNRAEDVELKIDSTGHWELSAAATSSIDVLINWIEANVALDAPRSSAVQTMRFRRATFAPEGDAAAPRLVIELASTAADGGLLVAGELLQPTNRIDDHAKSPSNPALASLRLANGILEAVADIPDRPVPTPAYQYAWRGDGAGGSPPIVILLNVTDEAGLPVALEIDQPLPLEFCAVQVVTGAAGLIAVAESPNRPITSERPTRRTRVQGQLRGLKWNATEGAWAVISSPSATRICTVDAPRTLHGFAHNAWIQLTHAKASLEIHSVWNRSLQALDLQYSLLALSLSESDATLNAILDEEEYAGDLFSELAAGSQTMLRAPDVLVSGVASADFRLPISDPAVLESGDTTAFASEVRRWRREIDDDLIRVFQQLSASNNLSAAAGFKRAPPASMQLASVLGEIPRAKASGSKNRQAVRKPNEPRLGRPIVKARVPQGDSPQQSASRSPMSLLRAAMCWLVQTASAQGKADGAKRYGSDVFTFGASAAAAEAREAANSLGQKVKDLSSRFEEIVLGRSSNTTPLVSDNVAKELHHILSSQARDLYGAVDPTPEFVRLLRLLKALNTPSLKRVLTNLGAENALSDPQNWINADATLKATLDAALASAIGVSSNASRLQKQDTVAMLQRAVWSWSRNPLGYDAAVDQMQAYLSDPVFAKAITVDDWVYALKGLKVGSWPPKYFSESGQSTSQTELPQCLSGVVMSKAPDLDAILRLMDVLQSLTAKGDTTLDDAGKTELTNILESEFRPVIEIRDKAIAPLVVLPVNLGQEDLVGAIRGEWEQKRRELLDNAAQELEKETEQLEARARDVLKNSLERLNDHVALDDETLEEIRKLDQRVRQALATAMGLRTDGERILRSLRGFAPAYVAAGRGLDMGIDIDSDEKLAAARDELEALTALVGRPLDLCKVGAASSWRFVGAGRTVFVLKLSKRMGLGAILEELQRRHATKDVSDPLGLGHAVGGAMWEPRKWVIEYVDPVVAADDWQGLILINPQFDLDNDQVVKDVCGLSRIDAKYVAFAKPLGGLSGSDRPAFDVWARASVRADPAADSEVTSPALNNVDAKLTLLRFDVFVGRSRLLPNSRIDLRIDIGRLFGNSEPRVTSGGAHKRERLLIVGRVLPGNRPGESTRFSFSTELEKPKTFEINRLVFKELSLRRISAALRNGQTTLEIDGDLKLRQFSLFTTEGTNALLRLTDFRLNMPGTTRTAAAGVPRGLRFDFGAMHGTLSMPRGLTMGMFEIEIAEFGYIRSHQDTEVDPDASETATTAERIRLGKRFKVINSAGKPFSSISNGKGDLPYVVFAITFGGLPSLDHNPSGKLRIDVLLGLNSPGQDSEAKDHVVIAAGNAAGSDIRFDLFRVLQVYLGTLIYETDAPRFDGKISYSAFFVDDFRLSILGWDLIGNGEARGTGATVLHLQDEQGNRGFATFLPFTQDRGLVVLDWVLLGRNIKLRDDTYRNVLEGGTQEDGFRVPKDALVVLEATADSAPTLKSVNASLPGDDAWLFGIHFNVLSDMLNDCALLLQDGKFYGIRLRGKLVQLFDNVEDGALTVAYQPGPSSSQDRFYLSTRMPLLDFLNVGAGGFTSGVISIGWSFNTDTLISLGFPFREGAQYRWDNSFACYQGIYQAHFGFYAEKRTSTIPAVKTGDDIKRIELRGGIGVEFGYGVSLGGGWLYVRAGIGIFVIVEGAIQVDVPRGAEGDIRALLGSRLYSVTVNGVIGVIAYVDGYIHIWIISARFRADLQAALACSITWTRGSPMVARYDATVYAGYYASACLDCGITQVCRTIKGQYPIRVSGATTL